MFGVTGATGKLGQLVIEYLVKKVNSQEIVAIVRNPEGLLIRIAEYDDKEALNSALKGIDTLLLISGSEIGKRIVQHKNIIDAAKANNVKKIVYTSVPMRFAKDTPLLKEHYETEEYLKNSGLNYVIMENSFYMEVMLDNLQPILNKGEYLSCSGKGGVGYVSRRDLAKVASTLLTSSKFDNKTFELKQQNYVF